MRWTYSVCVDNLIHRSILQHGSNGIFRIVERIIKISLESAIIYGLLKLIVDCFRLENDGGSVEGYRAYSNSIL